MSKFGNTGYHFWFKLRSVNIHWYQTINNDLSSKDVERAEFAFSIYDSDGTNVIDAVDLGNVLRALNLNPTNATIEKLGGTKKKGEKKMKLDEFLPIFSQCKKDKEQGCYEDFLECLKLYDKQENGMMLGAELSHTLLSLGERLNDEECDTVIKDCMDPEDDDGFIPYARKYHFILGRVS
ncbi:Myosin light chain alkali [Trachymyrmex septentrionalis]|uniref:Myosin light chain alkali n=1 Tax=Trachymyrmex septentrionalis TaxID=34720 RepID=A0A151JVV1_9HYME|nr:Myosin light chain alkali [Trachymyrmex septentrionalis]